MNAIFRWMPGWGWLMLLLLVSSLYLAVRLDSVNTDRALITLELDTARAKVEQLIASNESRKKTQKLLLELDTLHTQEQARADETNQPLLAAVATGTQRVYINARCPAVRATPGATGEPDEGSRAQLDPAVAERILHTGVDGDDAIRQLTALQEYVSTVCLGRGT